MTEMPRTVGELMSTDVLTLREDQDLLHVGDVMHLFRFRHMPVTAEGRLVGLVTERDLLSISASSLLPNAMEQTEHLQRTFHVRDVMTRDVKTVGPWTPLTEAARLLTKEKVGCLPVVDDGNVLVGIVTEADFVRLSLRILEGAPV